MGKFNKKTVKDVELKSRRVLVRADYNVPFSDGGIGDNYRLRQSLPTLEYILKKGPKALVIISHLGRPTGPGDKQFSLEPVAEALSKLLDRKVHFANDCVGEEVKKAVAELPDGGILLLQNLRFHAGEEKNDKTFAQAIVDATQADVFVQDGFGVVHRKHASTDAITHLLPSVAGLLLVKEIETILSTISDPESPFIAIIGGAKISDKIDVLAKFIELADCVAVTGALANNFLTAEGFKVGKSLVEPAELEHTKEILHKAQAAELKRHFSFLIPKDMVVSTSSDGHQPTRVVDLSYTLADIQAYPKLPAQKSHTVQDDEMILDIGPITAATIAGAIRVSKTAVWCGTAGITETKGIAGAQAPFEHGTRVIFDAVTGWSAHHQNKPFSLAGGGDTVEYIEKRQLISEFNYVSTGGSASLELMAGHKLPGVEALQDK